MGGHIHLSSSRWGFWCDRVSCYSVFLACRCLKMREKSCRVGQWQGRRGTSGSENIPDFNVHSEQKRAWQDPAESAFTQLTPRGWAAALNPGTRMKQSPSFFMPHCDARFTEVWVSFSVWHSNAASSCEHCDLSCCILSIHHSRALTASSADAPTGPWGEGIFTQYSHQGRPLQASCQGLSRMWVLNRQ